MVHNRRQHQFSHRLAKESSLLPLALDQMHGRAGPIGERARDDDAGKSSASADIEPNSGIGREIEELERIRDVAGPDLADRGAADQIGVALRGQQERDETVEPICCFT